MRLKKEDPTKMVGDKHLDQFSADDWKKCKSEGFCVRFQHGQCQLKGPSCKDRDGKPRKHQFFKPAGALLASPGGIAGKGAAKGKTRSQSRTPSPPPSPAKLEEMRNQYCPFKAKTGKCTFGEKCWYSHDDSKRTAAAFICAACEPSGCDE